MSQHLSTEHDTKALDVHDEQAAGGDGDVDVSGRALATAPPGFVEDMTPNQILDAYRATLEEHTLKVKDAIRIYWKAVFWIVIIGLCGLGDQYDNHMHNGVAAWPSFCKAFGKNVAAKGKKANYQLSPEQQLAISDGSQGGHIVGFLIHGYLADRIGSRRSVLLGMLLVILSTFLLFFAQSFGMFLAAAIIQQGIAGFVNAVTPAYAIELAPLALRAYAPLSVHLCEILGNLIGAVVEQRFADRTDQWAWRIPFAIEWTFPVPLIALMWFCPESPWWLVRKGRDEEALKSLGRLHDGSPNDEDALALVQHTVQLEKALHFGGSYLDVFRGVNLRRTEIAFMACLAQYASGFGLKGTAYFMEQAGLAASDAFALSCGQFGLGFIATCCAMKILSRYGRRPLWFIGFGGMTTVLVIVASLALAPNQTPAIVWPQGALLLVHFFFNNLSVGPLSFTITTEIGAVRLRRKTISIGRIGYDIAGLVGGTVSPYLLNPTAANLKGKAAWIPAGLCALLLIYGYFRLPETRGRNSEEIDLLFVNKVPARKFASYVITTEQQFGIEVEEKATQMGIREQEVNEPTVLV